MGELRQLLKVLKFKESPWGPPLAPTPAGLISLGRPLFRQEICLPGGRNGGPKNRSFWANSVHIFSLLFFRLLHFWQEICLPGGPHGGPKNRPFWPNSVHIFSLLFFRLLHFRQEICLPGGPHGGPKKHPRLPQKAPKIPRGRPGPPRELPRRHKTIQGHRKTAPRQPRDRPKTAPRPPIALPKTAQVCIWKSPSLSLAGSDRPKPRRRPRVPSSWDSLQRLCRTLSLSPSLSLAPIAPSRAAGLEYLAPQTNDCFKVRSTTGERPVTRRRRSRLEMS
jgi:hypothetical protein